MAPPPSVFSSSSPRPAAGPAAIAEPPAPSCSGAGEVDAAGPAPVFNFHRSTEGIERPLVQSLANQVGLTRDTWAELVRRYMLVHGASYEVAAVEVLGGWLGGFAERTARPAVEHWVAGHPVLRRSPDGKAPGRPAVFSVQGPVDGWYVVVDAAGREWRRHEFPSNAQEFADTANELYGLGWQARASVDSEKGQARSGNTAPSQTLAIEVDLQRGGAIVLAVGGKALRGRDDELLALGLLLAAAGRRVLELTGQGRGKEKGQAPIGSADSTDRSQTLPTEPPLIANSGGRESLTASEGGGL